MRDNSIFVPLEERPEEFKRIWVGCRLEFPSYDKIQRALLASNRSFCPRKGEELHFTIFHLGKPNKIYQALEPHRITTEQERFFLLLKKK